MKVIGLCGGSGSGKGTVSKLFLEHGIPSIDTDAVYREMTNCNSPCLRALANEFGDDIVSQDGSLDRKRLASIVFGGLGSEMRLNRLNKITHRFILDETRDLLENYKKEGKKAVIVDAPALFESGFDRECDEIICVTADVEKRLDRIMSRDGISREFALQRVNSQMRDEELVLRSNHVIVNNADISSLHLRVSEIARKIF